MRQTQNLSYSKNESIDPKHLAGGAEKLRVVTSGYTHYINVNDIVRIQSISNYSKLFFADGQTLLASKVLGYFDALLAGSHFSRIHRTHLVNLAYLKNYVHGTLPQVGMCNNERLPVSRRKRKILLQEMKLFSN